MHEPSPQEIRELRARHGLSQAALGALVHVQARSVQRWEAEAGQARQMPAAIWELALAKLGEIRLQRYTPPKPKPKRKPKPKLRRRRRRRRKLHKATPKIMAAAPKVVAPKVVTPTPEPAPKPAKPAVEKPPRMTKARLESLRAMAARSFGLRSPL